MDDPWEGIHYPVIFSVQRTIHTTLSATLMRLVFGQDAILNLLHDGNLELIKLRKQELIDKKKCVNYMYTLGELVLV